METVSWTDALSTGIDEIDAEHRYYFEILHRFNKARADGLDPHRLRTLLNDLVAYIEMHFRHEEAIMREAGYPAFERHITGHRKAAAAIQGLFSGDPTDAEIHEFLNSFLTLWLINHIRSEDRKFGDWLDTQDKRSQDNRS